MLRHVLLAFMAAGLALTPLSAAPRLIRYEADVETLEGRKVAGLDRQVMIRSRRVMEIEGETYRLTDTATDGVVYGEFSPDRMIYHVNRGGVSFTADLGPAEIKAMMEQLGLGKIGKNASKEEVFKAWRRATGRELKTKTIGAEVVDGRECTISEYRSKDEDGERQYLYWTPKDPKHQKLFGNIQRYTYRLTGDDAWLESAEVVRNIRITEE